MLQNIKTVTKGSVVYGLGNISIKLVGLVLIPIYTNEKFLSVGDFGVIGIIDITSQLIVSLLGLSLSQALTRWYYEKDFQNKQKSMFYSIFAFLFLVNILSTFAFISFSGSISQMLFKSEEFRLPLVLMFISSGLQIMIALTQTLMKIQQKPGFYTTTNIVKLIVTLILTIVFIVLKGKGIDGIYEAQIYGSLVFFVTTALYIHKNMEYKLEYKLLRDMMYFSFPLILASTSGILISILDKYILNILGSIEQVSIYMLAFRLSNFIKIFIVASVQMAVSPLLFQIMNEPNNKRFYSKYMTYFAFIVMMVVLFLSMFSYEIVHVFARNKIYYIAYTIVPILSFAFLFGMLKDTASTGLQITKKTGIISIITIFCTLLNIGLNYLFIPFFSYYGSAIAFLLSQVVFFLLTFWFAQKNYTIPYEFRKVLLLVIVGMIFIPLSYFMNDIHLFIRIPLKLIIVMVFPVVLYFFGFYEPIEIQRIREAWIKWRNPFHWKNNLRNISGNF
jgi:O-antigen/teichoic acid export membrane protein